MIIAVAGCVAQAEGEENVGEEIPPYETPWYRRHGFPFPGLVIPFGCGVYFKPATTIEVKKSQPAPSLKFGVFLGSRRV